MKKHLIAAAVAAAVAVPAMAQVTVSGVLDVAPIADVKVETSGGPAAVAVTGKGSFTGADNGWSTSEVVIAGTEDLGGGLKLSVRLSTALAEAAVGPTSFANRDRFLSLAGGFGTVRFGRFVPAASMGFFAYTQAGTNGQTGNIYGIGNANTVVGNANNNGNFGGMGGGTMERNNNQIQYTTPNFNGITANFNYGQAKTDISGADRIGDGEVKQQGLSLIYAAGPLSLGIATNERTQNTEAVPAVAAAAAAGGLIEILGANAVANQSAKAGLDWAAVSYNFGVATVGLVTIRRDGNTTNAAGATTQNTDISANSIGATVPFGAVTFRVSMYEGENDRTIAVTDDLKLNGHQVSLTYSLSKRTFAYMAVGESKAERQGTNVGAGAQKTTSSAIGLSHSF